LRVECLSTGAEFRDFFKRNYGPTIAVYRFIAHDPPRLSQRAADREVSTSFAVQAGGERDSRARPVVRTAAISTNLFHA
jgi:hypothetical protein